MALPAHLQSRYLAGSMEELAQRVSHTVGKTPEDRITYQEMMSRKRFIPAGNTLLAGVQPVRPNCSILPPITNSTIEQALQRSMILWVERIGIGFDLSELDDPVGVLEQLSAANASIDLGHRPQRGNMAVLKISHPKIRDFITCKTGKSTSHLYNFNISVGVRTTDLDDPTYTSIFELMAQSAWASGDPGIVFLDKITKVPSENGDADQIEVPSLGKITTTVPCSEQGMFPEEICGLGALNLACPDFWTHTTNGTWSFNKKLFQETIQKAVRFLDDTIDIMELSDVGMKAKSLETRRIGLGVMGWADVLHQQNIKYASQESIELAHKIGAVYKKTAHKASRNLAVERGICPCLIPLGIKRRNLTITCVQPTGGINLLTGNKGFAIEPFFAEAHDLSPEMHLQMQAIWQQYLDNCISKTVNLRNDATVADILQTWFQAASIGLKSVTVYRDGSKYNQPMTVSPDPNCKSGSCDI
jgi:ribonucleoside-diphosphate reductase alpha chain